MEGTTMRNDARLRTLAAVGAALLISGGLALAGEAQDVDRRADDHAGLEQALTAGQGADRVEIDFTGNDRGSLERALTFGAGSDAVDIDLDAPDRGSLQRAWTAGGGSDRVEIDFGAGCRAERTVRLWQPFNALRIRVRCR